MLKASNISKTYGDRRVLESVTFVVNAGECLGVVAPNGAGKTTLLDILARELVPDSGSVSTTSGARVGFVRQGFARDAAKTVADVFPLTFGARDAAARIEAASIAMADARGEPAVLDAQNAYDEALTATASTGMIEEAWGELRVRPIDADEELRALSGGEQTKLSLIEAFALQPAVLLLDEPTNNLDLEAAAWLDEKLEMFSGAVVMVSHDRALLDDHATSILELDPRSLRAEIFAGNYSAYAGEKARRRDAQWAAYRRQQDRERRVRQEIRDIKSTASRREHLTQNDFYRRKAKKVARRAVVLERRLERGLESSDRVEKPVGREYAILPHVTPSARGGDRMLAAEKLRVTVGGRMLVDGASLSIGWGERVVIVGANGTGKTTLLRALVGETQVESGVVSRSPSLNVGYLPQDEVLREAAEAHPETSVSRAPGSETPLSVLRDATQLSETEARRFLHRFLFEGDAVHTRITELSYGERRRLLLAKLVLAGANLLVLDEPTNHLDIPSREALESALDAYEGAILAVTHDRYFIERFASRLLELRDRVLRSI